MIEAENEIKQLDSKAILYFMPQTLIIFFFLIIVIIYFLSIVTPPDPNNKYIVFFLFILWPLISLFTAKLIRNSWKYQLTEKAIKIEKGVIWKKYISIPYNKIQNIDIYRGIIDRILGLSKVQIQTAGYSITKYGVTSEGQLPGLNKNTAETLREALINKVGE